MTIDELSERLEAKVIVGGDKIVSGVYAGDFLSRVMGKAPSGCVWLTVMNNVNVAGVATLAEIGAVALCEGVVPDERLTEKCRDEKIPLLCTKLDVFGACARLAK